MYINRIVADLDENEIGKVKYDLVTCFYFYDRLLLPKIIGLLKPQGMFILEQFSIDHLEHGTRGPRNPDYLVKPNELLGTFKSLKIIYYEDTIVELDAKWRQGTAAIIRLIVQNYPVEANII
ncbi:TPA: hypothetical protein EYM26_13370 [Candidatus Poribacteria bacterium]|nr:hypothetical protein [Candidatus Poribacteria bacterium]